MLSVPNINPMGLDFEFVSSSQTNRHSCSSNIGYTCRKSSHRAVEVKGMDECSHPPRYLGRDS